MTKNEPPWEKELIVPHALFTSGMERLEHSLDVFGTPDAAKCLSIIGGVATGKSTLIAHFQNLHPASDESLPIVVAGLTSRPSVASTIDSLVNQLGIPFGRASGPVLIHRLFVAMKTRGVRVLAVEEFERIFDWGKGEQRQILALLKDVTTNTGISLVLLSTEDLKPLLTRSPLSGRLETPVYLGPLAWSNLQHRQIFLEWLQDVQNQIAPFSITALTSEMALRIQFACGGAIGRAMQLIRDAMRLAGRNHSTKLTVDTFAKAYEGSIWYQPEAPIFEEKELGLKAIENIERALSFSQHDLIRKFHKPVVHLADNSESIPGEGTTPRREASEQRVRDTPHGGRISRRPPHGRNVA